MMTLEGNAWEQFPGLLPAVRAALDQPVRIETREEEVRDRKPPGSLYPPLEPSHVDVTIVVRVPLVDGRPSS